MTPLYTTGLDRKPLVAGLKCQARVRPAAFAGVMVVAGASSEEWSGE